MKTRLKRLERGQELVEFALVLILFLVVLMVIFDMGRAVYYYSAIHNAAREGARHGIADQNAGDIQAFAQNVAVGLDIDPVVGITEDTVTVSIDYVFVPVTPVLSLFAGENSITLHSQATMRIEK
jgi:Flp pilus assembly protein TadG